MAECYDCGFPYGKIGWIECIVPDKVWLDISPTKSYGGILCINCISKRIENMNYKYKVPIFLYGTERITPVLIRDDNFVDTLIMREWHPNMDIIKEFEKRNEEIEKLSK